MEVRLWLFGYELPDSLMVFTEEKAVFLVSPKKSKSPAHSNSPSYRAIH